MANAIAVGNGEPAGIIDCYDFAPKLLRRLRNIALDLALENKSVVTGGLAAELFIALQAVESTDAPKIQRRMLQLLKDLESLCAWPKMPAPHLPIIRALVDGRDQKAETSAKKGIVRFAKSPNKDRGHYLKSLIHFSKGLFATDVIRSDMNKGPPKGTTDEYPSHVTTRLYTMLKAYSLCDCDSGRTFPDTGHYTRLRLQHGLTPVGNQTTFDKDVGFDMLISDTPRTCYWQDFEFRIPLRKTTEKAKIKDEDSRQTEYIGDRQATATVQVVQPAEFCNLVRLRLGCRIRYHVRDSKLHRLHNGLDIEQNVDAGDSISLREVLKKGRLSNRMTLALAYIVAWSFWQYYDSPWMDSPWTIDSVHFLRESPPEKDTHWKGSLYASKPYFAVDFKEFNGESTEYCDEPHAVYPYPRLLSLCVVLLEIGRGQALPVEDHGSLVGNLNRRYNLAKRLLDTKKIRDGVNFIYYQEAIKRCLTRAQWERNSGFLKTDVFARKAVVHDIIVQPLEKLLSDCGFSKNLHLMDPIDESSSPTQPLVIPAAPDILKTNSDSFEADRWLLKIQAINECFLETASPTFAHTTRVAILDTGFDENSDFFSDRRRRRQIKGWKDFVEFSKYPMDEAGHGTHTTATAMKVAPHASIYVARIAKNLDSLTKSSNAIIEAIDWAANEVKADIISMSFGFQHEDRDITRALRRAIDHRKDKLLFFAAASNSGGNGGEMFPANLDDVFSIRETNSRGTFSDTNPPVDPHGPVAFGTLGKDVSSAWLSTKENELCKSGSSVATAVAAGIAALLIMIGDLGVENKYCIDTSRLRERRGMYQVLERLSRQMGPWSSSRYIYPEGIFVQRDVGKTWIAIADACTRSL